jgi:dephospho-CoA kinase
VITVGVTGGIGAGKSRSAQILSSLGHVLVDTDDLARESVLPGTAGFAAVLGEFGREIVSAEGEIDRRKLGEIVFRDTQARQSLEQILHPRIQAAWRQWLEEQRQMGRPLALVVIPLLFEKGYGADFDVTVSVACSAATQHSRLSMRGWSDPQICHRLNAQLPVEEKIRRSRYVVWNEGSPECLRDQWLRILQAIRPG